MAWPTLEQSRRYYKLHREQYLLSSRKWRSRNPDYHKEYSKQYYQNHSEEIKANSLAYRESHRTDCLLRGRIWYSQNREYSKIWKEKYKKNYPLQYRISYLLNGIRQRCENPNNDRYKYYGHRGIKCLLSKVDIEILWKRDKAFLLTRPSIDRINSKNHYKFSNCRFIELSENSRRASVLRRSHRSTPR